MTRCAAWSRAASTSAADAASRRTATRRYRREAGTCRRRQKKIYTEQGWLPAYLSPSSSGSQVVVRADQGKAGSAAPDELDKIAHCPDT